MNYTCTYICKKLHTWKKCFIKHFRETQFALDLGQKSEEVHRFHCFERERERETLNLYDIK